ncbi:MAG: hypothetical protein HXM71_05465 [Mogibacterium diversum]|jgi:lipoprotein|uniref:DUF5050 domain-containing protein n=1 Tax=Mogibacterium diversum TaxID=114527 RepID=A0A930HB16_9FIRM|nr:hypothetical protein [Mogibacterium diversum]
MSGAKLVKKGNIIIATILLLFIVACCVLAAWISNDNYTPKRVSNSASITEMNRNSLYDIVLTENDRYIIYGKKSGDGLDAFVCLNKQNMRQKNIDIKSGDKDHSPVCLYKNSVIYVKPAKGGKQYDIYSFNIDRNKERTIVKNVYSNINVIDGWLYCTSLEKGLIRISLNSGKKQVVNKYLCNDYIGMNSEKGEIYFDSFINDYNFVGIKINSRRLALFLRSSIKEFSFLDSLKRDIDEGIIDHNYTYTKVIGIDKGYIWFYGINAQNGNIEICKAMKKDGKWKTTKVIRNPYIKFDFGVAFEKEKVYYTSSDKTEIHMYDTRTEKDVTIYKNYGKCYGVYSASGDNLIIKEWGADSKGELIDNNNIKHYYINNSGKVLYELD